MSNGLAKCCSFLLYVPFATSLRRFSQSGLKLLFFIFSGMDCASFMCDLDKTVNKNITNLERVLSVRLAQVWRSSSVYSFTRGKTLSFLSMQKMCAEVDAHNKWITFIRRSRQIFNKFWRTPSESQSTDQNSSFFVPWIGCVTGPLVSTATNWIFADSHYVALRLG